MHAFFTSTFIIYRTHTCPEGVEEKKKLQEELDMAQKLKVLVILSGSIRKLLMKPVSTRIMAEAIQDVMRDA